MKTIETRSWRAAYRGDLAIHAGAGLGPVGGRSGLWRLVDSPPFRAVLLDHFQVRRVEETIERLPLGQIIAVATLAECLPTQIDAKYGFKLYQQGGIWTQVSEPEASFGDYSAGRFAWMLRGVRPLGEPLPYRGALGLSPLPPDVVAEVQRRAA